MPAFRNHLFRDAVESLCNAPGDAGQRVAVAVPAEGYRRPDHILEIGTLQEGRDGFRNRLLTALNMAVGRPDFITGDRS